MPNDKSKSLRIGVLILPPSQLLDVSPIDLFGMLTREYLEACRLPAPILALGIPVEIHYISATASPHLEPSNSSEVTHAECTANAALRITATIHDTALAPGKLDIVLIPGPDPSLDPPEGMRKFIRNHFDTGCVIMSVCTGIFPLAASGVLKDRKATGPRALLGELRRKYPETVWSDKRWCKDGNVWSSGMSATSHSQSSNRRTAL
jgi:transcriptional regulator GlxA family with amidase domain